MPIIGLIDQAYLDAKRAYDAIIEQEVQELAVKIVNETLRPMFSYWSEERLLAYGRDQAWDQMKLSGRDKPFMSKVEWVRENYPNDAMFFSTYVGTH